MKVVAIFVIVALCLQCWVACANVPPPVAVNPAITTTTPKSWGKKIKDGLDTFFKGAAVLGVVQGAVANHKSYKSKPHIDAKPH